MTENEILRYKKCVAINLVKSGYYRTLEEAMNSVNGLLKDTVDKNFMHERT